MHEGRTTMRSSCDPASAERRLDAEPNTEECCSPVADGRANCPREMLHEDQSRSDAGLQCVRQCGQRFGGEVREERPEEDHPTAQNRQRPNEADRGKYGCEYSGEEQAVRHPCARRCSSICWSSSCSYVLLLLEVHFVNPKFESSPAPHTHVSLLQSVGWRGAGDGLPP